MPGRIQSIERAVAVLRLLDTADQPLELHEIADTLGLARTTTHGIVTTLRELGLVGQIHDHGPMHGRYEVAEAARLFGRGGPDPHELRSLAMNWADSLAAQTGLAVTLGVPTRSDVLVVHHVFRPDGTPQQLAVGQRRPLHASALGKALLAFASSGVRRLQGTELTPYTKRTIRTHQELTDALAAVRQDGFAIEDGELEPDRGAVAAPVQGPGGLAVAAVAAIGRRDDLFRNGQPRQDLVEPLKRTARALSREVRRLW
ncbi:MAG TPA: IclR family transcriptional regulator [Nocardioidaceae bacterium]|nr:IclR family transcriptional regulator [Nocardioidaceae bacterium]